MSYTDLTAAFAYQQLLPWSRMDALGENDNYDHFPAGTKTAFYQSALPTGWTKVSSVNDSTVRVVSGAGGGSGGVTGLSSTVTLAHTHGGASHLHGGYDHAHGLDSSFVVSMDISFSHTRSVKKGGSNLMQIVATTSGVGSVTFNYVSPQMTTDGSATNTSSDTPGTTNSQLSDITFAYSDVLFASKDAGSYTDLTTEFGPGDLITWQNWDALGENDKFNYLPSGTKMLFFQAVAPVGWTQVAAGHNQKALRAVDGAGAGGVDGGGATLVGGTITLAHSHTTPGHTHTYTHLHTLATASSLSQNPTATQDNVSCGDSDGSALRRDNTSADTARINHNYVTENTAVVTGSTAPTTDSQLADIVIKYFDAMICSKT